MKHQKISDKYSKWIIEFHSSKYDEARYFVWLTDISDKNQKDQIITTRSNRIIVAKSKKKLVNKVLKYKNSLPDSKRIKKWLNKSLKCNKLSSIKYDLRGIEKKILSKKLKSKDIEVLIDFVNMFEDYKIQIEQSRILQKPRTKELDTLWNYYYDQIFWPNFRRSNPKKHQRSKLKINHKKLLKEYSKMILNFEDKFEKKVK